MIIRFDMRPPRRTIIYIVICSIIMFCIFKFFALILRDISYVITPVTTIHPTAKKHWFNVKITNNFQLERKSPKLILLWTKFFSTSDYIPSLDTLGCDVSSCTVTSNRSYLPESDAMIFHLRDLKLDDMPSLKHPWQRWILLHHESPPHTPDVLKPLGNLFNWTATYRLDSDILLTPRVKKRKQPLPWVNYNFAKNKTRMVAWFVSNCNTPSNREEFVKELQKSIPVDIYGSCGQKTCLPKMSNECYQKIALEYRYYLAFENSICKDYVTEKLYHILSTDIVPVVMGGADYTKLAPTNSYIDALAFNSPRELAHFLLAVAKDEKKYNSYFDWRRSEELKMEHYVCDICKKLHYSKDISLYKDLHHWWFSDANCKIWTSEKSTEFSQGKETHI